MSNVAINNNMNQSSLSAEKPSRSPNDSVGEKSQFAQNRNKSNDKESETIRSEGGKKNDGQEYLSSQNTWRNLTRSAGIATDGRKFFESESEVIDPTRSDSFYYNPGERKARLDNEYKQEDRYIDVIENDDEHPY